METLRPLRNSRFTDILDYGVFLYKKHFRKIILLDLMFYFPFVILFAVINPVFTERYMGYFTMTESIMIEPDELLSSMATLYAMIFGSLFIYAIYWITLHNVLDGSIVKILYTDVVLKSEKTIGQAVRECFRQFGKLMAGKIFYGMIIFVVAIILYLIVFIGIFAGTFSFLGLSAIGTPSSWLTVVLIILAIVLFIAVLFFIVLTASYFSGKYWMFLPAVCIEHKKAGSSIGRCGNLGKNSFFLIGLSYLTATILVALFPGVMNTIVFIISSATGNIDIRLWQIGSVVSQLFAAMLQPLITCIMTALYITLKVKREGLDIEIALSNIIKDNNDKANRWMAEGLNVEG